MTAPDPARPSPADQTPAQDRARRLGARFAVSIALLYMAVDITYKSINNITFLNRDQCILYRLLPRFWFLVLEYIVELSALVMAGIFFAVLLEKGFRRFSRYYPRNPVSAFLYASVIPVCACTAIPLVQSMREKMKLRTLITFVVAAPLLNPAIITLAFSVMGWQYALLRIGASFILAISSGYVVEWFSRTAAIGTIPPLAGCKTQTCGPAGDDVYLASLAMFRAILPYLLLAGVLGIAAEYAAPREMIDTYDLSDSLAGLAVIVLIGLPLYFCNGAEILLLRPLTHYAGMPLGTAVAFSLTATAVCITSLIMLYKFIGRKLTIILVVHILAVSLAMGFIINLILDRIGFGLY